MNMEKDFCRLCLKKPLSEFTVIDETAREMLDVLLVKMNFDISDNPLMCGDCTEILKRSLSFKSVCMDTEEIMLFSLHPDEHKNDVCSSKKIVRPNHGCRFCMKRIKNENVVLLDVFIRENSFSDMVKECMFHMDLRIIKNPTICLNCRENMESYFKFFQNCRDTEKKITQYQQSEQKRRGKKLTLSTALLQGKTAGKTKFKSTSTELNNKDLKIETEELIIKDETTLDRESSSQEIVVQDISGKRIYQCDICEHQTNKKSSLKTHSLVHMELSDVKLYKCKLCKFRTKYKQSLKNHQVCHQGNVWPYQCDLCEFKSKHRASLNDHRLVHKDASEVKIYECENCTFKTKHRKSLKTHMLQHKNSEEVPKYSCSKCDFQSIYKGSLKAHLSIHEDFPNVAIYKCESCSFRTRYKSCLTQHLLKHKDSSEVRMYECDVCGYKARFKSYLKTHLSIHRNSREVNKYKCKACNFVTIHKNNFKRHSLTHRDISEMPVTQIYQCYNCEFKSKYKEWLQKHVLSHRGGSEGQASKAKDGKKLRKSKKQVLFK